MAKSDDQEAIYKEFEERSRSRVWISIPVLLGGLALVVGRNESEAMVFGLLSLMGGGIGLYVIARCPACDASLLRQTAVYCPWCGVRLKRPGKG